MLCRRHVASASAAWQLSFDSLQPPGLDQLQQPLCSITLPHLKWQLACRTLVIADSPLRQAYTGDTGASATASFPRSFGPSMRAQALSVVAVQPYAVPLFRLLRPFSVSGCAQGRREELLCTRLTHGAARKLWHAADAQLWSLPSLLIFLVVSGRSIQLCGLPQLWRAKERQVRQAAPAGGRAQPGPGPGRRSLGD